jgi:hypothetical protein
VNIVDVVEEAACCRRQAAVRRITDMQEVQHPAFVNTVWTEWSILSFVGWESCHVCWVTLYPDPGGGEARVHAQRQGQWPLGRRCAQLLNTSQQHNVV